MCRAVSSSAGAACMTFTERGNTDIAAEPCRCSKKGRPTTRHFLTRIAFWPPWDSLMDFGGSLVHLLRSLGVSGLPPWAHSYIKPLLKLPTSPPKPTYMLTTGPQWTARWREGRRQLDSHLNRVQPPFGLNPISVKPYRLRGWAFQAEKKICFVKGLEADRNAGIVLLTKTGTNWLHNQHFHNEDLFYVHNSEANT